MSCKAWSLYSTALLEHDFDVQHSFCSLSTSETFSSMEEEAFRSVLSDFAALNLSEYTRHGGSEPSSGCFQGDLKVRDSFLF